MIIKKLITNQGQEIPVSKFTVLVGPNNVGKSRTLRDINDIITLPNYENTILIKKIEFEKPSSFDDIFRDLIQENDPRTPGLQIISGLRPDLVAREEIRIQSGYLKDQFDKNPSIDLFIQNHIGKFKLTYLDA